MLFSQHRDRKNLYLHISKIFGRFAPLLVADKKNAHMRLPPVTALTFFFWLTCLSRLRGELQAEQQSEPYEVPAAAGRVAVAASHTAAVGAAVPRAAAQNT
jgi:hypothetical protein